MLLKLMSHPVDLVLAVKNSDGDPFTYDYVTVATKIGTIYYGIQCCI